MENERSLNERFQSIEKKLANASILLELGKANELNFFIFDYDPKNELDVRFEVRKLKSKNPNIIEFDLFDIIVELFNDAGYLDKVKEYELKKNSNFLLERMFQPFISVNEDNGRLMTYFKNKIETKDDGKHIILITGVGKSYPIIRSHNVLNNLQRIVFNDPVVMMYPGRYDQKSKMCLSLFDRLGDDNYYRAFPLEERISK